MKISNLPVKGTADWMPEEFAMRNYIFGVWRDVCLRFGYQEYLTPIVELADVYRAKSGEDVGGKELTVFTDRGGRELAIRPEMTPSVTRMVSRNYESTLKPIRLFSVANFFRNEKPQKGRNREFWQLNYDIFGSTSANADIEIVHIGLEIMKRFGATSEQFVIYLNDRYWIQDMVGSYIQAEVPDGSELIRVIDKFTKLDEAEFIEAVKSVGVQISDEEIAKMLRLLNGDVEELESYMTFMTERYPDSSLSKVIAALSEMGYSEYIQFNPAMVRGFDYYDGMVFEVFDKNSENSRSLFGGGRYNGLAGIFGSKSFPAVGAAPGDETLKLFLEGWQLMPAELQAVPDYYIPVLSEGLRSGVNKIAAALREDGSNVVVGLENQSLSSALEFASKIDAKNAVIYGEDEASSSRYTIRELTSGEQKEVELT